MIEVKNLYKRYHNHHGSDWVLRNINLKIPTGTSVGLIGANGAGKSTLLRLIAGIDTPEHGEVIRHSRVSWPVGLSGGIQGSMTGRQNVKFVARVQGQNNNVDSIVQFVRDFASLGPSFDAPVKTYSSGMRSRLSFGMSLAFDFDIYISDEATSVGDRAFKNKAKDLFKKKINESSLIMVSHSDAVLREFCQAGIYIQNGSAQWYDSLDEALARYNSDIGFERYISLCNDSLKSNDHLLSNEPKSNHILCDVSIDSIDKKNQLLKGLNFVKTKAKNSANNTSLLDEANRYVDLIECDVKYIRKTFSATADGKKYNLENKLCNLYTLKSYIESDLIIMNSKDANSPDTKSIRVFYGFVIDLVNKIETQLENL